MKVLCKNCNKKVVPVKINYNILSRFFGKTRGSCPYCHCEIDLFSVKKVRLLRTCLNLIYFVPMPRLCIKLISFVRMNYNNAFTNSFVFNILIIIIIFMLLLTLFDVLILDFVVFKKRKGLHKV